MGRRQQWEGGDAEHRSHAAPLSYRKSEEIEAVWIERGEGGEASRGKCRLLHTPLGGARTGAFQAFSVYPPAMPGDIYSLYCKKFRL